MTSAKRSKAVEALMQGALKAASSEPADYLADKQILIVDEESSGLEWVAETLRQMGGDDLEISTARGFNAAMDICLSHDGAFDLVLIEQQQGAAHDGLELLGQMRRAGLPRQALTILYSSQMTPALRRSARAAGFAEALATADIDATSLLAALLRHWEPPEASR